MNGLSSQLTIVGVIWSIMWMRGSKISGQNIKSILYRNLLVDGDLTQIDEIEPAAKAFGVEVVIMLDIIHVLEYLWKGAKVWLHCDDPKIAQWVYDKISQGLQGQVKSVVRHLRRGATAKRMNSTQREPIDKCATYLAN